MIDMSKEENRIMVCSRDFAEWLQMRYVKEFGMSGTWLDAILRYCNAGYPETMREEMKKGNEYTYRIKRDQDRITLVPSYELVEIDADSEPDTENLKTVAYFADRYSVITTAARFPGKQQFPNDDPVWEMKFLVEECSYQAQSVKRRHGIKSKPGTAEFRKEILEKEKGLCHDDKYSYTEFASCGRDGFVDNQMPFCYGPSCVDRLVSNHTYHNVLKGLYSSFEALCKAEQIEKTYQELFLMAMCSCAATQCMKTGGLTIGLAKLLADAEKTYAEFTGRSEETGASDCKGDFIAAADLISLFMRYEETCTMTDIEECTSPELEELRNEAWKQVGCTYERYRSPQEIYG